MRRLILILFLGISIYSKTNRLNQIRTVENFHTCMLGSKHKPSPSAEPELYGMCEKWKGNSCCYHNVSHEIENHGVAHGFSYNHCKSHNMSKKCYRHFLEELCFYECSPDLGPWLVKVSGMKIRAERFFGAPLCRSECEKWWEDCRDDFTCVSDWSTGFVWKKGRNVCPKENQCEKFSKIYGNAKFFCESVWDQSWKVVENNEHCFRVGLSGPVDLNMNYLVSNEQAIKIFHLMNESSSTICLPSLLCLSINFVFVYIMNYVLCAQ